MEYGDLNSDKEIYIQIIGKIRDAILSGELAEGKKIPSGVAMATGWNASHQTVLNATRELIGDRLLQATKGAGTFVMDGAQKIIREQENGLLDTLMIPMLVERAKFLDRDPKDVIKLIKNEFDNA